MPEPGASFGVEPRNVPAFERAVTERVSDWRSCAKRLTPCLGLALKIVQQDAVAIECKERAMFHLGIIGEAKPGRF